ncbi:hypothetical protein Forpe1208_v001521 [Fusarium oxysporum f. sp. rapae]|uniref:Uncharacterized protein n=1 Tax=Fusarium oxysporum f. sp. rapae TaxID=485398 RepID=A0A8J5PMF7_FUSOX|nr:hypothetical protein Forpe1208_v001521 [Fusarium oxysporum f. sp. rapae]
MNITRRSRWGSMSSAGSQMRSATLRNIPRSQGIISKFNSTMQCGLLLTRVQEGYSIAAMTVNEANNRTGKRLKLFRTL